MRTVRIGIAGLVLTATLPAGGAFGSTVFEVDLIPCTAALCEAHGTAVLAEGRVKVDEDGRVELELERAAADATLCLVYDPITEDPAVEVGEIQTDDDGDFGGEVGTLDARSSMGVFRVTDCAEDTLYITGFSTHPDDDSDIDDDGESNDDDSDDDGDGVSDDDDSDADGDGISDEEDCDGDHVSSAIDTDDDNDGIPDADDPDDDNDGIPDPDDADPDCPGAFDDIGDATTLKTEFREAVRDAAQTRKTECAEARATFKEEKGALKDEFRTRRNELR